MLTEWSSLLKLENRDPNYSFDMFYNKINFLLIDGHVPTRNLSKKQLKNNKPWITKEIRKSIVLRDKVLKKFINSKNIDVKNQLRVKYKHLRNAILNDIKISKFNYYKNFFNDNLRTLNVFGKV